MREPDEAATSNASSAFASWKVNHAGIRVPDFDEAVAWYTGKLDFRLLRSTSIGRLTFGFLAPATDDGFSLEILAGPGTAARPSYDNLRESFDLLGWHHLGLRVGDVDVAICELARRGVRIVAEPRDVAALDLRIAFFADPWGNLLEVIAPIGR